MKILKIITLLFITLSFSCNDDFGDLSFLDSDSAPTNLALTFDVTEDNSGKVKMTPTAEGAYLFDIYMGDEQELPERIKAGATLEHTYPEGSHQVRMVAYSMTGKQTEKTIPLEVSFKAPENLNVVIENDLTVSNKVNFTVNADFAMTYTIFTGESATNSITANIGESISYIYQNEGVYEVTIEVKGAAIQTAIYTQKITALTIKHPNKKAPLQPKREASNVISVFAEKYPNLTGTDFNPDWGQGGQGSGFIPFSIDTDQILQYTKMSYQGIQLAQKVDLTPMDFLYLDIWTSGINTLDIFLISASTGEKSYKVVLNKDTWTSVAIPLSEFTSQGLSINDIHQLKFVAEPWATHTLFIDNIYFYKEASSSPILLENFEDSAPIFTSFGNMANTEVIDNPYISSTNSTSKVAKSVKNSGSEVWAGTFFESSLIDLKNYNHINMKVWTPKSGITVKVKLENVNASITHEQDVVVSETNQWKDITFDFSKAPVADYVRFVVFFDFGSVGDDTVYYYDEIKLN